MTQWDFQNKGKSHWTGTSSFVLEVPLRHLRPSVIYSVPCDRILQRAYSVMRDLTSQNIYIRRHLKLYSILVVVHRLLRFSPMEVLLRPPEVLYVAVSILSFVAMLSLPTKTDPCHLLHIPATVRSLKTPPGGGYLTKFNTGRLRPEVQPLTLLYTILAKKVPFYLPFW